MLRSQGSAAVAARPTGLFELRAVVAALKRRPRAWIAPSLVAFALTALALSDVTPRYTAETQILLQLRDPNGQAAMDREVRRIRSAEMARRAIVALHLAGNDEFDPLASGVGPLSRVLVVLGLSADPTRELAESRLVRNFSARLDIVSQPETHVVTVRFTSRDRDLAARGANMLADLYLEGGAVTRRSVATGEETKAQAGDSVADQSDVDGRVIERAAPPQEPSSPRIMPLLVVVTLVTMIAAAAYVAFSNLVARRTSAAAGPEPLPEASDSEGSSIQRALDRLPRRAPVVDDVVLPPPEPVRAAAGRLGSLADYIAGFGRSAAESRAPRPPSSEDAAARPAATYVGWDGPVAPPAATSPAGPKPIAPSAAPPDPEKRHAILDRIVADHVPGRGLHIVGTEIGAEEPACQALVALAQGLAEKGRSIIVDLNATPARLAPLSLGGRVAMLTLDGLSELLAGESSFAEVIHRDHASRLHFIPTGRKEADFRDFDLILDALTETYDFIVLLTPAFPHSEIAKVMAPYADIVVLVAADDADRAMVAMLENDLIAAGAREVLVTGTHPSGVSDKIVA